MLKIKYFQTNSNDSLVYKIKWSTFPLNIEFIHLWWNSINLHLSQFYLPRIEVESSHYVFQKSQCTGYRINNNLLQSTLQLSITCLVMKMQYKCHTKRNLKITMIAICSYLPNKYCKAHTYSNILKKVPT